MNVFNPALSILLDITTGKGTFHDVMKSFFNKVENEGIEKGTTSVYVGCVLRHYYVINAVAKDYSPEANQPCILAIGLAIANALFLKRYENTTAINFVENVFKAQDIEFSKVTFTKFLNKKIDDEPLIHESLDKLSLEFIAQRYNIPTWISKMWSHNFSKNIAFKTSRAMSKSGDSYVRVNNNFITTDEFYGTYKDELEPSEISGDLFKYIGKSHVRRTKYCATSKAYPISAGLKEFIDKLHIDSFKPVIVYTGSYNLIPMELELTYNNGLKIENLTEPNKDMYLFKNNLNRFKVKGIRTTEATVSQFVTAISDKVGMFILAPDSSSLARLRIDPDYFLNFDRNTLDDLIANQKAALEEASHFIEDNGYLAYTVNTINKKEGQNLIANFLHKHKDFVLIEEVQHFPYDKTSSTIYYAILKKVGQNEQ